MRVSWLGIGIAIVTWPSTALPCSLPGGPRDTPAVDLGVHDGFSPAPPHIASSVLWTCDYDETPCCAPNIEIAYDGTDAELFSLGPVTEGGRAFLAPEAPGTLRLYPARASVPQDLQLTAWTRIGYRSETITFTVTEQRGYAAPGCSALPRDSSACVLLGLIALAAHRRRRARQ